MPENIFSGITEYMNLPVLNVLEIIGLTTFSASGAYKAMQKEMDLFGILIMALTCSLGGGLIRDSIISDGIPLAFESKIMIPISLASALITVAARRKIKFSRTITALDALGLGAFGISAGIRAINLGWSFSGYLFVSLITGIGGGILRDILCGELPAVLTSDIYAAALLAGSVIMWFLYPYAGTEISSYICITAVFAVRMICYTKKINLPVFKIKE